MNINNNINNQNINKNIPIHQWKLHFLGVYGMGMSALAELCIKLGAKVSGSDKNHSSIANHLQNIGVTVFNGHANNNIPKNADYIIKSSAIKDDNVELMYAKELGIPILHRSDLLNILLSNYKPIGVAGTHGKTTTTSLLGFCMDQALYNPLIISGGIMKEYGSTLRYGDLINTVIESDESDKSFINMKQYGMNIITNIDQEHMENYDSFKDLQNSFIKFANKAEECTILCTDNNIICDIMPFIKTDILSYGFNNDAYIRAYNIETHQNCMVFDVNIGNKILKKVYLNLMGIHNVQNALSVIGVLHKKNIDEEIIRKAFTSFPGVERRLSIRGCNNGITFIDDYAHHPTEIKAVLKILRDINPNKKIIAVLQPHRYSRLAKHFNDFSDSIKDADHTIVIPVYSAGEEPLSDVTSNSLQENMQKKGYSSCLSDGSIENIYSIIKSNVSSEGTVICMGAGDITNISYRLAAIA